MAEIRQNLAYIRKLFSRGGRFQTDGRSESSAPEQFNSSKQLELCIKPSITQSNIPNNASPVPTMEAVPQVDTPYVSPPTASVLPEGPQPLNRFLSRSAMYDELRLLVSYPKRSRDSAVAIDHNCVINMIDDTQRPETSFSIVRIRFVDAPYRRYTPQRAIVLSYDECCSQICETIVDGDALLGSIFCQHFIDDQPIECDCPSVRSNDRQSSTISRPVVDGITQYEVSIAAMQQRQNVLQLGMRYDTWVHCAAQSIPNDWDQSVVLRLDERMMLFWETTDLTRVTPTRMRIAYVPERF